VLRVDPAAPSQEDLKLPSASVLHLPVFSFFFHFCLLMIFHLRYRLNLKPTTPPLSTLFLVIYIYFDSKIISPLPKSCSLR